MSYPSSGSGVASPTMSPPGHGFLPRSLSPTRPALSMTMLSPLSHLRSSAPPATSPIAHIRTVLARPYHTLADRVGELNKELQAIWNANNTNLTVNHTELEGIFGMIMADIFGSGWLCAKQVGVDHGTAWKTGRGWSLLTITRHAYREYNNILYFLSVQGPLFRLMASLSGLDTSPISPTATNGSVSVFDYPASRIPNCSQYLVTETNGMVQITAFEAYIYHFIGLLAATGNVIERTPTMENDALYPALFEVYLTFFFPVGQAQVRFGTLNQMENRSDQTLGRLNTSPPKSQQQSLLLKKEYVSPSTTHARPADLIRSPSFPGLRGKGIQGATSRLHYDTLTSHQFMEAIILFWLQQGKATPSEVDNNQILANAVVKLVRMLTKHCHYFLNNILPTQRELRMSLEGIFKDYYCSLYTYLQHQFDHWPLDASFRLVLETWLSFTQPWRYMDLSVSSEGIAYSSPWEEFVVQHRDFYSQLLVKSILRFYRVDLSSNKNAYMLFRLVKVFSQKGLLDAVLKAAAQEPLIQSVQGMNTWTVQDQSLASLDPNSIELYQELLTRVSKAKQLLICKNKEETKSSNKKPSSLLVKLLSLLQAEPKLSSDAEEREKSLNHLSFVEKNLCEMFNLESVSSIDATDQMSSDSLDSSSVMSPTVYDSSQVMSPKARWNLVNRTARCSPKFNGNPDQVPLRSDEFHFLARVLYQLSLWLNAKFPTLEDIYYERNVKGMLLRKICHPSTTYRIYYKDGSSETQTLPPRLHLRPLASYQSVSYIAIIMLMLLMFGVSFVAKLLILIFFLMSTNAYFSD